jgi:hypothetical protein
MTTKIISYRGYYLHLDPFGSGFKLTIRPGGGGEFRRPQLPHSQYRDVLIAEAKETVDDLLDHPNAYDAARDGVVGAPDRP